METLDRGQWAVGPSTGGARDTEGPRVADQKRRARRENTNSLENEAVASTAYLRKGGPGAGKVGVGCSRIKVVLKEEER